MTAGKVSCDPIYLVKLSILTVASQNSAEVGEIHVFAVTAHVLGLDVPVQTVNLVHFFKTIEQLHSDVGNYGLEGLTLLQFQLYVFKDGKRKVLHNQEAAALNSCVMLVLRAFSKLCGEVPKEQALCEHVGGSWRQWVKLDSILLSCTLFLKDAHCALATEPNHLNEVVFTIAYLEWYLVSFRSPLLCWWYTLRLHI